MSKFLVTFQPFGESEYIYQGLSSNIITSTAPSGPVIGAREEDQHLLTSSNGVWKIRKPIISEQFTNVWLSLKPYKYQINQRKITVIFKSITYEGTNGGGRPPGAGLAGGSRGEADGGGALRGEAVFFWL